MKLLVDEKIPYVNEYFPDDTIRTYQQLDPTQLEDSDILITRSSTKINKDLLAKSQVTIVASPVSGCDHVDKVWLRQAGIEWFHAPGSNAFAVGEYVLGATALIYQLNPSAYTVGIIGYGHVGRVVARYYRQLGFNVLINDPPLAQRDLTFCSTPLTAFKDCDIVSIHARLNNDKEFPSYHLINDKFLAMLKPGCVVMNTARGAVLDTQAALKHQNRLTFIADVYEQEPNIHADYVDMLFLATPHIAGHSIEAKQRGIQHVAQQINHHLNRPSASYKPIIEQLCALPRVNWTDTVLQTYNPSLDRLSAANKFCHQRANYVRHEHHFIWAE